MASALRLSCRSKTERLAAWGGSGDPVPVDLLRAEACGGSWRIVEVYSSTGAPFEVTAAWSGGDGAGQEARLTVGRATRFSVYATSLSLRVANLSSAENRVGCTVSEGYCVSSNAFEVRTEGAGLSNVSVPIPPFAARVRVDCEDRTLLPSVTLQLLDGQGALRADLAASTQPPEGLPLGGAATVQLAAPSGLKLRVHFSLTI